MPPFRVQLYCPFGFGQGYCGAPALGLNSTDCDPFQGMTCPCVAGSKSHPALTPLVGDVLVPTLQLFSFPLTPDPAARLAPLHMYNNSCLLNGNSYQAVEAHLSGVQLKGPAEANGFNLNTSLIPSFCGGHVTPPAGPGPVYHSHKASGCLEIERQGQHRPLVGYAVDGFGIYGFGDHVGVSVLDEWHCHFGVDASGEISYHYHASAAHNRGGAMAHQPYYTGCLGPSLSQCDQTVSTEYDAGSNWCGPKHFQTTAPVIAGAHKFFSFRGQTSATQMRV